MWHDTESKELSESYIGKNGDVELSASYEVPSQYTEEEWAIPTYKGKTADNESVFIVNVEEFIKAIKQVLEKPQVLQQLTIFSTTLDTSFPIVLKSSISAGQEDADRLQPIKAEIKDSEYIPTLEEDWDQDGALIIKQEIWQAATDFLLRYAQFILDNYKGIIIDTPEINPVRNGSVDLSWRTPKARMLINIREEKSVIQAYYYGDLYNNMNAIKGNVSIEGVAEHLAVWMKNLEK